MDEIKGSSRFPGSSRDNIQAKARTRESGLQLARGENGPIRQTKGRLSESIRLQSSGVLNQLRSTVNKQANNLISATNGQIDQAREARYNTTRQLRTAKTLRKAFSRNDQEGIQTAKEELGRLQREAEKVERKVISRNEASAPDRIGSLRSAGDTKNTFHVPSISFTPNLQEASSLRNAEDADEFISELREARQSLTSQIGDLRKIRGGIQGVTTDARGNLTQFQNNMIDSVEGAESEATALAQELRQAASADVSIIQRGGVTANRSQAE